MIIIIIIYGKTNCISFYNFIISRFQDFDEFYCMLGDEDSKKEYDFMVKHKVALAFLFDEFAYRLFPPKMTKEIYYKILESVYNKSDIDGFIFKPDLTYLIDAFLIEQYRLSGIVEPIFEDTVLDVGACYGDTALWFSKYVGKNGKVFAFEPENHNFKILEENVRINNAKNIIPEKFAIGEKNETLKISKNGSNSTLSYYGQDEVDVITIDEFVQNEKIYVNFIKMDIEGFELNALFGGSNTIKKYKPNLAIAVYHKGDDIITIPKYIKSLNAEYKFYLKSNRPNAHEMVLYVSNK